MDSPADYSKNCPDTQRQDAYGRRKPTYCLSIVIPAHAYDIAIAILYQFGMLGCEEERQANGIALRVYFPDAATAEAAGQKLGGEPAIPHTVTAIEHRDWNATWRESMKPARLARGYWVSPCWLPPPKTAKHWIKIEPKMAFGTGHHETTRLAAGALISQKKQYNGKRLLDIGTGSGILCFVAGACGARFSLGVEIDPDCREAMAENLCDNLTQARIAFLIGDANALKRLPCFDFAVMNMLLTESAPLLDAVSSLLKPGGLLVWSGILTLEYHCAVEAAKKLRFHLLAQREENEWWCGTFKLQPPPCS